MNLPQSDLRSTGMSLTPATLPSLWAGYWTQSKDKRDTSPPPTVFSFSEKTKKKKSLSNKGVMSDTVTRKAKGIIKS